MTTLTALYGAAVAEYRRSAFKRAEALCREILRIEANSFEALSLLGIILAQTQRAREAADLLGRAVAVRPQDAQAHNNHGNALASLSRFEDAAASYMLAIQKQPVFADAHYNHGNAMQELGRWANAIESYECALLQDARHTEAWFNLGNALQKVGDFGRALASYDHALSINSRYVEALFNRANVSMQLRRHEDALLGYSRVLQINSGHADAWFNRGNALQALLRFSDAADSYRGALQCRPDYPEAYVNLGRAQKQLGQFDAALDSYAAAIALRPGYADAFYNRGNTLLEWGRVDNALENYDSALKLDTRHAEAWTNRGNALREQNNLPEALESFEQALLCRPEGDWLFGTVLFAKMQLCQWPEFSASVAELTAKVLRGEKASQPIVTLALTDETAVQAAAAETWSAHLFGRHPRGLPVVTRHERIKIGYFSADFREHPVSNLACGVFEAHDRSRFEVIAFSFGPETNDPMRARLRGAFEKFIDVRTQSDTNIAQLSRTLGLDIAVDLGGYTKGSRPAVFAARAAPLQVSYLGYAGTMGCSFMNYLVADRTLIPPQCRTYYCEKIIYLPHCALPADSRREISKMAVVRSDWGLPSHGVVFCCFNNFYKIAPDCFESWMRILGRVEGSVLWLADSHPRAIANLRHEAAERHIDPARLIFSSRVSSPAEHLARHAAADLFLDTRPYNAHATACDALWAGLPVLTSLGNSLAGRVAASLLQAAELPELIAETPQDFEQRAIDLSTGPERLAGLKSKLASKRQTAPLFDTALYTRHLEAGFLEIYERHCSGRAPDHVENIS